MPSPRKRNIGRRSLTANVKRVHRAACYIPQTDDSREAFTYIPSQKYETDTNIGNYSQQCCYCGAKKWKEETNAFCCVNGEVEIPPLPESPKSLYDLLTGGDEKSKEFRSHVRSYNNIFAMTSIGCNEIREGYMPTFKIQGQLYHRIGSILPPTHDSPKFLQIYFVGQSGEEARIRKTVMGIVDANLVMQIQGLMHTHNKYVKQFKTAYDKIAASSNSIDDVKIVIKENRIPNVHKGRVNAPVIEEVAVVMSGEMCEKRDIIIEGNFLYLSIPPCPVVDWLFFFVFNLDGFFLGRNGVLRRVNETHQCYDPLQYPLLFPYGTDGYSIYLKQKNGSTALSAMQYYKYSLMTRDNNYLLLYGDLLNLYVVDMYAKIEGERALYIKLNQSKLRSEEYTHFKDSLSSDSCDNIGRLVVLPSSFIGSPRYMCEKSQDGLCYVRKFGTADLFITFTCNPKWEEITSVLTNQQPPSHRYDIVARVFKLKLGKLMKMITQKNIFGKVKCHMYTIEWQKRGMIFL